MTARRGQTPAPAAPRLPSLPQPGRVTSIPAGAGDRATPAGDHQHVPIR